MQLELHITDIDDDNKKKANEKKLKMRTKKDMPRERNFPSVCAFGVIVTLVAIVMTMIGLFRTLKYFCIVLEFLSKPKVSQEMYEPIVSFRELNLGIG
jgi:hypothetical protein